MEGPPPAKEKKPADGWSIGLRLTFLIGVGLGLWGLILFILFGG